MVGTASGNLYLTDVDADDWKGFWVMVALVRLAETGICRLEEATLCLKEVGKRISTQVLMTEGGRGALTGWITRQSKGIPDIRRQNSVLRKSLETIKHKKLPRGS